MAIKRSSHYVPQVYLRGFSLLDDSERVYWAMRGNSKAVPRRIEDVCSQKGLYCVSLALNEPEVEDYFAQEVDSNEFHQALQKIQAGRALTKPDIVTIANFISFQAMRTRASLKEFAAALRSDMGKDFDVNSDDFKKYWLKGMKKWAPSFTDAFRESTWIIRKAPEGAAYITSDHPVTNVQNIRNQAWGGGGLLHPGSFTLFPLSSSYALQLSNFGKGFLFEYQPASKMSVAGINRNTAFYREDFVLGHNKRLVEKWAGRVPVDFQISNARIDRYY